MTGFELSNVNDLDRQVILLDLTSEPALRPVACAPFAPWPLRLFLALTPARRTGLTGDTGFTSGQVSPIHVLGLPALPFPNPCGCSAPPPPRARYTLSTGQTEIPFPPQLRALP
jgi:hypothetical protein